MSPCFHPRLVNGPFGDPALFVPFFYEKRAFMFDLGDISSLSARDILKLTHIFVSHTHVDHFIGFDYVLRILLGRDKSLYLFGPPGFLRNVEGKLSGYAWNLVENYSSNFFLHVTEIHHDRMVQKVYSCRNRFEALSEPHEVLFDGNILTEPDFSVNAIHLDHKICSLGFSLRESFHVNILKDRLSALALPVGPWLKRFKEKLYDGKDKDSLFEVSWKESGLEHKREFKLGELEKKIARITPGQKIVYITDIRYTPENIEKVIGLARGANVLFIEACFIDADSKRAYEKYHLTARQAGILARKSGAGQIRLFHFSPRYTHNPETLYREAESAFSNKD